MEWVQLENGDITEYGSQGVHMSEAARLENVDAMLQRCLAQVHRNWPTAEHLPNTLPARVVADRGRQSAPQGVEATPHNRVRIPQRIP